MSSTPITDAAYDAIRSFTNEEQAVDALVEMREISRKLERENAALREELEAQAVVNGKGGEREAKLLAEVATLNETAKKHVAAYYELLDQNVALRADKERLDWLDDRCGWLTYVKQGFGGPWCARCELGKDVTGFGADARAAIDAARKQT